MSSIAPITFTASWTQENQHLKEAEPSSVGKIWQSVSRALFYGPTQWAIWLKPTVECAVLPCTLRSDKVIAEGRQNGDKLFKAVSHRFVRVPLEITAPDGTLTKGVLYQNIWANSSDIPTIIIFHGNSSLAKVGGTDFLLKQAHLHEQHYNVVEMDYRGAGDSRTNSSRQVDSAKLVLDGDSLYQCLRDQLKISEKNIHILGQSLGGAVGAEVAALHPEGGRYVNARSFSSLSDVIDKGGLLDKMLVEIAPNAPYFWEALLQPLYHFCVRVFAVITKWLFSQSGWIFNVESSLEKIKARSLLVYHPQDEIIGQAGMVYSMGDRVPTMKLEVSSKWQKAYEHVGMAISYHNISLDYCVDEQGREAHHEIVKFLLGQRA